MLAGYHNYTTRGAVHEAFPFWCWLWDLWGSRTGRSPKLQRWTLVIVRRTPIQPDVLPTVPRLCWAVSTARPRKKVGETLPAYLKYICDKCTATAFRNVLWLGHCFPNCISSDHLQPVLLAIPSSNRCARYRINYNIFTCVHVSVYSI